MRWLAENDFEIPDILLMDGAELQAARKAEREAKRTKGRKAQRRAKDHIDQIHAEPNRQAENSPSLAPITHSTHSLSDPSAERTRQKPRPCSTEDYLLEKRHLPVALDRSLSWATIMEVFAYDEAIRRNPSLLRTRRIHSAYFTHETLGPFLQETQNYARSHQPSQSWDGTGE
ncbi:hypothetical protein BDV96DRAFT_584886 [Lophiotrema nucula]|uniref:Uncharacterized protein n=1 Tax=Lophiotrema nucula TaxID=690887 RepID=A0A6A5YRZ5_9PLEO|nr:hypothetical protein BDV96DRAFT_584886 [Lophiotrema nucula]